MKLKLLFIALLFSVFVWQFAIPSFQKYLTAGVMVDKSWRKRKSKDSPSVSFCALNNKTGLGWKHSDKPIIDQNTTAIGIQCNNPANVEDALDCLHKETFNLTETIKTANSIIYPFVDPDEEIWIEDVMEAFIGRVFRISGKLSIDQVLGELISICFVGGLVCSII